MPDPRASGDFLRKYRLVELVAHPHTRPNLIARCARPSSGGSGTRAGRLLERCAIRINGIIEHGRKPLGTVGNPRGAAESAKNATRPPKVSESVAPPLARNPRDRLRHLRAGPYASKRCRLRCRRHPGGAAGGPLDAEWGTKPSSSRKSRPSEVICIDAKSEAGRALVAYCAKNADVVSHNSGPA